MTALGMYACTPGLGQRLAMASLMLLAAAWSVQAAAPPVCSPGCQVILATCNATDPAQVWKFSNYSAKNENSLSLVMADPEQGRTLCLDVAKSGKGKGDDVWVSNCSPEHPDTANRGWEFAAVAAATGTQGGLEGKLRNTRSGFCAFETPPQHSPEAPGHTVLADCSTAPAWKMAPSGLIHSLKAGSKCLSVDFAQSIPPPGPPPPAFFGDVRDRLGCQLPTHTDYPFCDTSKSVAERAADLVSRIKDEDKPALLTARADRALPYLGVPSYYYGTNCLHSAITECAGDRCPTSFPAATNWIATFDSATMTAMAATVGRELRAAFVLGNPDNTHAAGNVGLQCWGPVVALNRDPRWGRNGEGGAEDPRLAGAYGAAWARGLQRGPPTPASAGGGHQLQAVVTLKHYDAQTVEDSDGWDRHNISANVSRYMLMDSYLPAFGIAIRAGAKGVMCSYNALNMTPTCLSPLLRAARVQWGFETNGGYVTSDSDAVGDAYQTHHYVPTAAAASCEAITKGGDQIDSGGTYESGLLAGVKQGLCSMADVDAALLVVMKMRLELGLFDPVAGQPMLQYGAKDIGDSAAQNLNLLATQRSLVLLKDGQRMSGRANTSTGVGSRRATADAAALSAPRTVLPLAVGARTAVLGPHYNASWVLVQPDSGDVCSSGGLDCIPTPISQIARLNQGGLTTGALGSYLLADSDTTHASALRAAALAQARAAEQIVLFLGIRSMTYSPFTCARQRRPGHETAACKAANGHKAGSLENFTDLQGPYADILSRDGPGDDFVEAETHDRRRIDLPRVQQQLATAVVALGKPTVLVLFNGGAVALPPDVVAAANVAVVEAFYPGTRGSEAIASAIFAVPIPPTTTTPGLGGNTTAAYVDRFGRLPYSVFPQAWTEGNKMSEMDLAAAPGRTYKYSRNPNAMQFEFATGLQFARFSLTLQEQPAARHVVLQADEVGGSSSDGVATVYSLMLRNLPTSKYPAEAVVAMFMSPTALPTQPKGHPLLMHRQLVSFQVRVGTGRASVCWSTALLCSGVPDWFTGILDLDR